jgi:hypothetical protein
MTEASVAAEIRATYRNVLAPLALRGLKAMLLPDGQMFCHTARPVGDGTLQREGASRRYSAMALIGLEAQAALGRTSDIDVSAVRRNLAHWARDRAASGDAALVLWALSLQPDDLTGALADRIVHLAREGFPGRFDRSSMSLGWLLTGLCAAARSGVAADRMLQIAGNVRDALLASRCQRTGLFSLSRPGFRRNIVLARTNAALGSFASQVYPIIALSHYSAVSGRDEALRAAKQTADLLCRLQGPEGQWWWIYSPRKGAAVVAYPVYSVHQDAMGPMALLAVRQAGDGDETYLSSIARSLAWLDGHPECPQEAMIDREAGAVWRAIQRDRPDRTGAFGLGLRERLRMHLAAWMPKRDGRPLRRGHVCRECRPYHLGWILLAAAWAQQEEQPDQ